MKNTTHYPAALPALTITDEQEQCKVKITNIAAEIAFEDWWRSNVKSMRGNSTFAQTRAAYLAGRNDIVANMPPDHDNSPGMFGLLMVGVFVGIVISFVTFILTVTPN